MAALDWVFLVLLLVSVLIGAWRGLVFELLSVSGWVLSFFVAQWLAADIAALLPMGGTAAALRHAAGFVVVFLVSVFLCGLLAWLGKKLIDSIGLRPADRALGAAFGMVRGVVLLLALAVVARLTPLHETLWWQQSQGVPVLVTMLKGLKPVLPEELGRHLPS